MEVLRTSVTGKEEGVIHSLLSFSRIDNPAQQLLPQAHPVSQLVYRYLQTKLGKESLLGMAKSLHDAGVVL